MTVDPAGSAAAALNTQTSRVQQPPQPPVSLPVNNPTEPARAAQNSSDLAQTSRVNENSRLGNFIDTYA